MPRTVHITSSAMPELAGFAGTPALEFKSLHGSEELCETYRYRIQLQTPDLPLAHAALRANVPVAQLVGKELTLYIELDGKGHFLPGLPGRSGLPHIGQGQRQISGIVTQARFLQEQDRRGLYEVTLEPWLSLAQRTSDFKVFQDKTVVQILEEVLSDYPFAAERRVSETYPVLGYQVQYGESDYDFISRLMREWGLYYFFEHSEGVHRMVIVDSPATHRACPSEAYRTLAYFPPGHQTDEEHLSRFDSTDSLRTGVWISDDFYFKKPKANLAQRHSMPRNTGHNALEVYQWPGDFAQPEVGAFLTRVRMEEAACTGWRATGSGNVRGLVCGHTFTLHNHPTHALNQAYLVLSSTLEIEEVAQSSGQGDAFTVRCHVEVQPANQVFRAPQRLDALGRVLKPRTHGPQTAVVTGPPGREIHTDEYGRVKLSFHWNRYCSQDHASSCWVRVSSPWAGNGFGGISIPRVGQEVVVDFEHGDPDRPMVIGRVFNALNMPPWELPGNQTQSGLLTRSTENGGTGHANALRFEDLKGREEVWLHAERNHRAEVEHDESHWVGNNRTKKIDKNESTTIGASRSESVGGSHSESIAGERNVSVGKTQTNTVKGNVTLQSTEGEITIEAATKLTLRVGSSFIEIVDGNITVVGPSQVDINP